MTYDKDKGGNALAPRQQTGLAKSADLISRGLGDLRKMEPTVAGIATASGYDISQFPGGPSSARNDIEHYREIVFAFSDLMAVHSPIIGDCAFLPHPKATILYAIKFVVDDYETKRELGTDPTLIESYDRMIPTLNYLFTCLARDWHDIAPEDEDAIAKLAAYDSLPDWALPLKRKYINDERASIEAADAAFRVLKDRVGREPAIDRSDARATKFDEVESPETLETVSPEEDPEWEEIRQGAREILRQIAKPEGGKAAMSAELDLQQKERTEKPAYLREGATPEEDLRNRREYEESTRPEPKED